MSSNNNDKQLLTNKDVESKDSIVEEKIIKVTGDYQIHRYIKGRLLGKGINSKCYEFTSLENKKIFAAKITPKIGLIKK